MLVIEYGTVLLFYTLFHTCTVVILKARSPMVRSHACGTISCWVESDRSRWRDSNSSVHHKSLAKCGGARFWRQRKTSKASRKCSEETFKKCCRTMCYCYGKQSLNFDVNPTRNGQNAAVTIHYIQPLSAVAKWCLYMAYSAYGRYAICWRHLANVDEHKWQQIFGDSSALWRYAIYWVLLVSATLILLSRPVLNSIACSN